MTTPNVGRPYAPGYAIPQTEEGLLPWSYVEEQLTRARNYWIVTVQPDGLPHTVPIWAARHEGVLYFGGPGGAHWVRNLRIHPNVVVHLESGEQVVILKGKVYEEKDRTLVKQVDTIYYGLKYGGGPDPNDTDGGWLALKPRVVLAWSSFPTTATRWKIEGEE